MKKYLSYIFQAFVLLFLIASAVDLPKAMLRYSGYCLKQDRYLTTQEKFDIVVSHIINRKKVKDHGQYISHERPPEGWRRAYTVDETGGKVWLNEAVKTSLSYSSLEHFYALNPGCCELVEVFVDEGGIYDVPFWYRLSGHINIIVRVFYIYDIDQENNSQPIYKEEYFALSNCGNFYWGLIELHDYTSRIDYFLKLTENKP
ncbi:hypothetical protein LJB99_06370 [Deltaproteobacteria bacterium OttesenSCG-928-K17]|nr:hypothetical protein [Deltaproteobacteria bacterium OttesenSCG-928-K17]